MYGMLGLILIWIISLVVLSIVLFTTPSSPLQHPSCDTIPTERYDMNAFRGPQNRSPNGPPATQDPPQPIPPRQIPPVFHPDQSHDSHRDRSLEARWNHEVVELSDVNQVQEINPNRSCTMLKTNVIPSVSDLDAWNIRLKDSNTNSVTRVIDSLVTSNQELLLLLSTTERVSIQVLGSLDEQLAVIDIGINASPTPAITVSSVVVLKFNSDRTFGWSLVLRPVLTSSNASASVLTNGFAADQGTTSGRLYLSYFTTGSNVSLLEAVSSSSGTITTVVSSPFPSGGVYSLLDCSLVDGAVGTDRWPRWSGGGVLLFRQMNLAVDASNVYLSLSIRRVSNQSYNLTLADGVTTQSYIPALPTNLNDIVFIYALKKQDRSIQWSVTHTNVSLSSIILRNGYLGVSLTKSSFSFPVSIQPLTTSSSSSPTPITFPATSAVESFALIYHLEQRTHQITQMSHNGSSITCDFVYPLKDGAAIILGRTTGDVIKFATLSSSSPSSTASIIQPISVDSRKSFITRLDSQGSEQWTRIVGSNDVDGDFVYTGSSDTSLTTSVGNVFRVLLREDEQEMYVSTYSYGECAVRDENTLRLYRRKAFKGICAFGLLALSQNGNVIWKETFETTLPSDRSRIANWVAVPIQWNHRLFLLPSYTNTSMERLWHVGKGGRDFIKEYNIRGTNMFLCAVRGNLDPTFSMTMRSSPHKGFYKQILMDSKSPTSVVQVSISNLTYRQRTWEKATFALPGSTIDLVWDGASWLVVDAQDAYLS